MTILFDAARPVHPGTARRSFGHGILPAKPSVGVMPYTAADLLWWARNAPSNADAFDVLACEAAAQDRLERGSCL